MNAFFRQNLEPMICTPVEISQRRFYGATGAVKGAPMLESLGLAQAFDFGGCRRPGIGRSVRKETKTFSGVHQKFLLYCEVERRLSPQTVTSYRSDFRQFTEFLRSQSRWGLVSQDLLGALSMGNVRDYQYYMAEQGWATATVQRRLVSLNRFGVWLVKRGHAKTNPLAEMEEERRSANHRIKNLGMLSFDPTASEDEDQRDGVDELQVH